MAFDKNQYKATWDAAHTAQIKLKLNDSTDADILEWLAAQDNKQGYIKALIRADIARSDVRTIGH